MAGGGCNVPLWPFILAHLWLSVWGFQAAVLSSGQWVTHSYAWMNFAIVALGCWTAGQEKMKENCLMLIISLIIGFIFDIVFIAVYDGNWNCAKSGVSCGSTGYSEFIWSYVMAIFNCLLKIVTLIFAICEYKKRGGKAPTVKASVSVS